MIKAIIFDCFGVLAGSGFKEIYRQAGGDLARDGEFLEDVLKAANSDLISSRDMHQQVADRIGMPYEAWYDTVQKGEQPNEELLTYIKELRSRGYKTAILSNANKGTLDRKFSPDQLQLFDRLIVSAEVGMLKPDAEIYNYAAAQLGVEPTECVFTDDSLLYCDGAKAIGMEAVCYQNFSQFKRDLENLLSLKA